MSYFRDKNIDGTSLEILELEKLKEVAGIEAVHIVKLNIMLERNRDDEAQAAQYCG